MALQGWFDRAAQQSEANVGAAIRGVPEARGLTVARDEWRQAAEDMAAGGGRLLAHWASRDASRDNIAGGDNIVHAAFIADAGVLVLSLPLTAAEGDYPGIE